MIENQYQLVVGTASGTAAVDTSNLTVHTVVSPKASAGVISLKNPTTFASYVDFPVGTIGTLILDASFPAGLSVYLSGADAAVCITYQKP